MGIIDVKMEVVAMGRGGEDIYLPFPSNNNARHSIKPLPLTCPFFLSPFSHHPLGEKNLFLMRGIFFYFWGERKACAEID